jgi:hypothetical protein
MELPIKDKLAVIFHGIIGGTGGRNGIGEPNNILDCSRTIKYNVLSAYDCDIFAHSWSVDHDEEINTIYHPVASLFQHQEYFGFNGIHASDHQELGQAFRTISRYTSLERALKLKQDYEILNNFKYKWVLVIRYDIVFFTRLDLSKYDPAFMYICSEPHWENDGRYNNSLYHDVIFLSSSAIMDTFSNFPTELKAKIYDPMDAHAAICQKILRIFNGNTNMIKRGFKRYNDVEIYRMVINPQLNPIGHAYGALEMTKRFNDLINQINEEIKP